jgi:hypothetical protein
MQAREKLSGNLNFLNGLMVFPGSPKTSALVRVETTTSATFVRLIPIATGSYGSIADTSIRQMSRPIEQ